jgi:VCBS repeat-containing protein
MDFKNSDITTGPAIDLAGADAAATLEAAAILAVAVQSANILPLTADGQLVLPAGVGLDDIKVVGRDLVIQMPDGTQMIVPDGAIFVPQIVVEGVAVPALNIAALLIGQEPQPAAGRLQSSGGNFADAVGDIGDPFGLGDLLPPTQLAFLGPEEREIIPGLIDRDPDVVIQDGGPASTDVVDNVSEVGLPGTRTNGNVESPGSSTGNGADSTTGTIFVTSPDGIASITINGVVVTGTAGQQIVTARGVLTLGALSNGQIGYTYRLTDNTSGDTTTDIFTVAVTDPDGDVATARLTINIADDVPTARNDTDSVPAGIYSGQTGNVITGIGTTSGNAGADTQGADGAVLSGIRAGTGSGTFAGAGTTINGQYGTLTISANGSYTYTRNAGTPGGVNDVFTYQLTDGDGDASTATLTISIADSPVTITSVPTAGAGTVVDEAGLPARGTEPPGSNAAAPSESTSGTISFTAPDGVASVSINGVTITGAGQVIAVPTGTLLITGYNLATGTLTYTFTLTDNTSGDATTQVFSITVTDTDGDTDTKPFTIRIIDDTPTAVADTDSIAAGNYGPATGNVISDVEGDGGKDVQGADGVLVTNVAGAGGSGGAGTAVNGLYGVLTINADGSYSYVRNAGSPGGVSDVFTYTITDADGDASSATLTIAIADSPVTLDLPVKGAAGTLVDEAGLPAGSNAAADSEKTTGTIAYAAADGPASVTIDGVAVTAVGQIFTSSFGTLKITSIANGVVGYEYLLTTNTSGDATFDDFAIVVTDQDGDSSSGTLVVDIIDDVPTARADFDSVTEDDFGGESESVSADGNVITGVGGGDANDTDGVADTKGADGATVTAVAFGAVAGTVNGTTDGAYGTLTLNADGSYSYVLNNFDPRVQGLDSDDSLTEVFTYTLTDGDGDARTTTLTITINGSDDGITINGLNIQGPDLIVDDDDLPAGSDPVKEPLTQTGSFTINGVDGISSIKIEGVEAFVGQTFTTAYGTFTITSIVTNTTAGGDPTSITVNYSYTLNDNVPHPVGGGENTITEVFDVDVTDTDGSTESGTVKVLIIDDVPDANNDSAGPVAENAAVTVNVIANDIQGADGVNLTTGVALVGGSLTGTGTLVYNADGTFTYTPAAGEEGLVTFNYQITDGDGDTDIATVTIDLGKDSTPTLRASDGQADERALPDGSNPGSTAETTTGTIAIGTGSDGIGSLVINGVNVTAGGVVVGAYGTLTVTLSAGVYSYSYTLTDNTTDHPTNPTTGTSEGIFDDFNIVLTDSDGDVANDTITIDILDDGPTARNDTVNQDVENTAITFDVFGNDTYGADGVDIDNNPGVAVTFTQPATGTVSYDPATGLFTFTPVAGQLGTVTYTYTIIDGDGDPSTATVTINLKADSVPTVRVTDVTVNEDGLPARAGEPEGTSFGSNSHIGTGSFFINTGGDTLQKLELRDALGNWVDVTAGGVVNGANGTLVVSVLAGVYTYTYTLTDNLENHPDFVTIDGDGISDAADSLAGEAFDVRVTDSDNSVSAIDTLNVTVLDDAPSAANDVAVQTAENAAFTIAVFGNDLFGADGVATSSPGKVTFTQATYGVVSYDPATGLFTYTPNAGAGSLSTTDSFTYTIIDGDGDPSTATVALTLQPDSTPTLSVTDITVDEKGLPNGSGELANPALNTDNSETGAGAFSISTGNDGIQAVEVQNKFGVWINVTAATVGVPVVVQGNNGTLTVTSNGAGSYSYSYTLTNNLLTHDDILIDGDSDRGTADQKPGDAFAVRVTDTDGDTTTVTAATTINVTVNDDGPTANNDAVGLTEGGPSFVTFDVDTNDVAGADGTASRVFTSLTGIYGNIVLNVDGTQTYTLTAAGQLAIDALPPGVTLTDTFSYTLTDGDNDSDPAQLVITLTGSDDPVLITNLTPKANGGDASVDEDDLPAGSDTTKESLTTTGNFNISAPDGVASLTIHGVLVVSNGVFTSPAPIVTPLGNTLTITAYNPATGLISYSYTLNGAETHANAAGENDLFEDFAVVLTDADPVNPDVANSTLSIRIVDDVPTARDDTDSVTEGLNNVADGNVFVGGSGTDVNATDGVADTIGADGPGSVTNARVGAEGAGGALTAVTVAGVVISGTYGNLLIKADGSYTYTLKTASIPAGVTSEVFTYEITDADGDKDLAQLTISLVQDARAPDVTGSTAIVYEDGLADGIQHGATSETAIGTFTVNASGENYTLTLDGDVNPAQTIDAVGQTVVTSKGVLTITSISAPVAGVVTYGYSYTLSAARTHTGQGEVNPLSDTITMTVTDATGDIDSTPGSIVISIVDDIPVLGVIQNQQTNNNPAQTPAVGTLHFTSGADGTGSAMTITANTTGITSGGLPVLTSQTGNVLTGYVNTDGVAGYQSATDTAVFTLTVNPNAGPSGQYVFDLITALDPTITDVPIGSGSSFGVGPSDSVVVTDDATAQQLVYVTGWSPTGGFTPAEQTAWQGGASPTVTQTSNVNGSTQGWGLGNNNFDTGEFLRFDFGTLDDYDGAGSYTPPGGVGTIANVSYATYSFFNFNAGETVKFVAHYTNGGTQFFTIDGATDTGTFTISAPAGTQIAWIDVYQSAGDMKLNLTNVGVASSSIDKTIGFTVQLSDGDGDLTTTNAFSVRVADGLSPSLASAMLVVDINGDGSEAASMALISEAQSTPLTPFVFGSGNESFKTTEQLRTTSNVTTTVIAASLVGLATTDDTVVAPTNDDAHLEMLPDAETATPDQVDLLAASDVNAAESAPLLATETNVSRSTGDEGSNLQAVDDSDMPAGVIAQPVAEISDSLNGGADTVSISDIVPTAAPMGGDVVMHDILDMAAAGLAAASNDNIAKLAIEDVVNEAMPDTMVDRLVEAFETDAGPPAIGGDAGADSSGYLVELINQSVSNSSDLATIHVDPFGSQLHDMTSTNNG